MSKKEPCIYFLRGTCRFGSQCKFSHQVPNNNQQLPEHKCNDPRACKEKIREDLFSEKPKHWRLTCYAHWRHFQNDISGDMSFEELRASAYVSARQGMSLADIQKREQGMFQAKESEFNALLKNPYKGPPTAPGFNLQSSGFGTPTNTVFGRSVPANSFASQIFNQNVSNGSGGFNSSGPTVSPSPGFTSSLFPPAQGLSSSPFPSMAQGLSSSPFSSPAQGLNSFSFPAQGLSTFSSPAQGLSSSPFSSPAQGLSSFSFPGPFSSPAQAQGLSSFSIPAQGPFSSPAQGLSSFSFPAQGQSSSPFSSPAQGLSSSPFSQGTPFASGFSNASPFPSTPTPFPNAPTPFLSAFASGFPNASSPFPSRPFPNTPFPSTPTPFPSAPTPFASGFSSASSPFPSTPTPFSNAPAPFSNAPTPFPSTPAPFASGFSNASSPFPSKNTPFLNAPTPFASAFSNASSPFSSTPTPFPNAPTPFPNAPTPFSNACTPVSPTPVTPVFQPGTISLPGLQSASPPTTLQNPSLLTTPVTTTLDVDKWQKNWELGEIPEEEPPPEVR